MTYNNIADIQGSQSLTRRLTACAWQEQVGMPDPGYWVVQNSWLLATSPGWADAWASAEAGGDEDPGVNEGVVTDGMILSAVQSLANPQADTGDEQAGGA